MSSLMRRLEGKLGNNLIFFAVIAFIILGSYYIITKTSSSIRNIIGLLIGGQ